MFSYLLAITSSAIPFIGIFAFGWSPVEIAYLWFAEALILIPLMIAYNLISRKPIIDWFMVGVYTFWMSILTTLFLIFAVSMGIVDDSIGATLWAIRLPILLVTGAQLLQLAMLNKTKSDEFEQNNLVTPMLTLHLTVVLGFALLGLLDGLDYGSLIAGVILVTVHTVTSLGFRLKTAKAAP